MNYFETLAGLYQSISVTDAAGRPVPLQTAVDRGVTMLRSCSSEGKIVIIGNGGSAAVASHAATDFIRSVGVPAAVFHDAALLTCFANDFGYAHVYARPLDICLKEQDALIVISSSGQSENILNAVAVADAKRVPVITLSGFAPDNPLRERGELNFYVASSDYGSVEIVHLSVCHCLCDTMMERRDG